MRDLKQKAHTLLFHKGPKVRPARDVPISSKDQTVTMLDKGKSASKPNSLKRKANTPVTKVKKTKRELPAGKRRKKVTDSQDEFGSAIMDEFGDLESGAEDTQEEMPVKTSVASVEAVKVHVDPVQEAEMPVKEASVEACPMQVKSKVQVEVSVHEMPVQSATSLSVIKTSKVQKVQKSEV